MQIKCSVWHATGQLVNEFDTKEANELAKIEDRLQIEVLFQ